MKTHHHKIEYTEGQGEYIIRLKKRCKPCWLLLLLLLLPLILLIPLKKDVAFKVLNSFDNSVVSGINVSFDYTKRDAFNFETSKFFTRTYPYPTAGFYEDTTNAEGVVVYKTLKYSVYQWLFKKADTTHTYAVSECFSLDTTINFFDLKEVNTIYMHSLLSDFEFTVVDASDNNEPLPDAMVHLVSDMFGVQDSMLTDAAGKVVFKHVPFCSNLVVEGYKYGWYKDTISGYGKDIYKNDDTLFLKQELEIVKFFAKDLYTKKALVSASGSLFFESDPSKAAQTGVKTNINGVGKGVFDKIHKIKKVRIDVTKRPFYNDSSTISYHVVKDWKVYDDDKQTILLRPNPNPILFKDIDCKTNAGLSNVENKVTIKKSDGTTVTETVISNGSGEFSVSAGVGDKITIEAVCKSICPKEYEPNIGTVSNVEFEELKNDAAKRKIPLCRKDAPKLRFQNTDLKTGAGIAGVKNIVKVQGGGSYTYTSGSGGWFEVDKVYSCEIISITATKADYKPNSTSIQKERYDVLMSAAANKRVIPLEKLPEMKPCSGGGGDNESGGPGFHTEKYNMGRTSGVFKFSYFTDTAPDRIVVKNGGKVLLDVNEATGPDEVFDWKHKMLSFKEQVVVVEVYGDTHWKYTVHCP